MRRYFILISMLFCALVSEAQNNIIHELETDKPGKGVVRVNQPERLFDLAGYRVLLYSGNNSRQARDEANAMADYMREKYPGAEVYVLFEPPIRSCLYGDYRTREEAEAVMYRLKATRKFREISVKKCMINLPY